MEATDQIGPVWARLAYEDFFAVGVPQIFQILNYEAVLCV